MGVKFPSCGGARGGGPGATLAAVAPAPDGDDAGTGEAAAESGWAGVPAAEAVSSGMASKRADTEKDMRVSALLISVPTHTVMLLTFELGRHVPRSLLCIRVHIILPALIRLVFLPPGACDGPLPRSLELIWLLPYTALLGSVKPVRTTFGILVLLPCARGRGRGSGRC